MSLNYWRKMNYLIHCHREHNDRIQLTMPSLLTTHMIVLLYLYRHLSLMIKKGAPSNKDWAMTKRKKSISFYFLNLKKNFLSHSRQSILGSVCPIAYYLFFIHSLCIETKTDIYFLFNIVVLWLITAGEQ